jgi:hypothetical protein
MDENTDALKAENTRLRGRIQGLEAEKRRTALEEAVAARLRAGLARDKQAEAEKLSQLDDATLTLLAEDADAVTKLRTHAAGPKARNEQAHVAYAEELEQARTRLFGHRGNKP